MNSQVILTDELFKSLTEKWRKDTELSSDVTEIVSHPAYREIVSHGTFALPFILKDLQKNGGLWHTALHEITGHNPVTTDFAGNIRTIREVWLGWGYMRRLI